MRIRLNALFDRVQASLFVVPSFAVLVAVALAAVATNIDGSHHGTGPRFPLVFTSTVESARALLQTVAGATIAFAGIAFSVSLLIIQQASGQFSPRVVQTLFRDPFNRRVMGLVLGTFTYCILVLRVVRAATEDGGSPTIPNMSIAIAVALGIVTILAVVAFIDHSAHTMDISSILADVEHAAIAHIQSEWRSSEEPTAVSELPDRPDDPAYTVTFDSSGWVQRLDIDLLANSVPDGTTMWVRTYPGRYAIPGTPLCDLSVVPEDVDVAVRKIRRAVLLGESRTMQQDVSFGLRQLTDVSLKALSPGINDPTTAQDAIFHMVSVLGELLRREPPRLASDVRHVLLVHEPNHRELIDLAFDEVRQAAAVLPVVCVYLLEALQLLMWTTPDHAPDRRDALLRQARLVVEGCRGAGCLPVDVRAVEEAFVKRFGADALN